MTDLRFYTLRAVLFAEIQTVCATREGMISSRFSSSRFISPRNLAQARVAWFGQGERVREGVIAALANPLGSGFYSISFSP